MKNPFKSLLRSLGGGHRRRAALSAVAGVVVFTTTYALVLPAITQTTKLYAQLDDVSVRVVAEDGAIPSGVELVLQNVLLPGQESQAPAAPATPAAPAEEFVYETEGDASVLPGTEGMSYGQWGADNGVLSSVDGLAKPAAPVIPAVAPAPSNAIVLSLYELDAIKEAALENTAGMEAKILRVMDVSLWQNGAEIEPNESVRLEFQSDLLRTANWPVIVHLKGDGTAEQLEILDADEETGRTVALLPELRSMIDMIFRPDPEVPLPLLPEELPEDGELPEDADPAENPAETPDGETDENGEPLTENSEPTGLEEWERPSTSDTEVPGETDNTEPQEPADSGAENSADSSASESSPDSSAETSSESSSETSSEGGSADSSAETSSESSSETSSDSGSEASSESSSSSDSGSSGSEDTVSVETDGFSIYAIVDLQMANNIFTYADEELEVTVTLSEEAYVPEEATFEVNKLEEDTQEYTAAEETLQSYADGEGLEVQSFVVYDMYFDENGSEVEPGGEVAVNLNFRGGLDLKTGQLMPGEVRILHMAETQPVYSWREPEVVVEDVTQDVVLVEDEVVDEASFVTGSFSQFAVVNLSDPNTLRPGYYKGNQTTLTYVNQKDAFTSDPAYDDFYVKNSPLGVAGSFHIVAFDTVYPNAHTNGNILARSIAAGSNFGTNNLKELSYIQGSVQDISGVMASSTAGYMVFGSGIPLTRMNIQQGNDYFNCDLGLKIGYNDKKIDSPKNILKDIDSNTAPFVDIDAVEREITRISQGMAAIKSTPNVSYQFTKQNNIDPYINLPQPDGATYISVKASDVNGQDSTMHIRGFQAGHDGSLIVNVDCAGWTGDLNLGRSGSGIEVYVDGVQQQTVETTNFSNGKVIWNFYNTDTVGTIRVGRTLGTIIAPGTNVDLLANVNGHIIAKKVYVNAQSHRNDFTGTLIPTNIMLKVEKTVNGQDPAKDENGLFVFKMENYQNGQWVGIKGMTAIRNSGRNVYFPEIEYDQTGIYWYRISEVAGSDTQTYTYDSAKYLVRVDVSFRPGTTVMQTQTTLYRADDLGPNGPVLNSSPVTDTLNQVVFRNKKVDDTLFSLQVSKEWFSQYGSEWSGELPVQQVTFKLYSSTNPNPTNPANGTYVGDYTITADDNWTLTVENLPKKDRNGNDLYYFAVEILSAEDQLLYTQGGYEDNGLSYESSKQEITIKNEVIDEGRVLPATGGRGTGIFPILGGGLMGLAVLGLLLRRRKQAV